MKFYNHVEKIMDATARKKENCPLDKKWLMPKIIYEPHITNNINNEHIKYVGVVETSFKISYSNHMQGLKQIYEVYQTFKIYLAFEKSRLNTHS